MTNKIIDNKLLHCVFYKQFIDNERIKLSETNEGIEILRWRVLYWLAVWEKEFNNCTNCYSRFLSIETFFLRAGIKLQFEPEVLFKLK